MAYLTSIACLMISKLYPFNSVDISYFMAIYKFMRVSMYILSFSASTWGRYGSTLVAPSTITDVLWTIYALNFSFRVCSVQKCCKTATSFIIHALNMGSDCDPGSRYCSTIIQLGFFFTFA